MKDLQLEVENFILSATDGIEENGSIDIDDRIYFDNMTRYIEKLKNQINKYKRAFIDIESVLSDSKQSRSYYIKDIIKKVSK